MGIGRDALDADVIVVGAGLAGAATAWAASRRGHSVIVLEQFQPGHDRGSSHGSARIVRRAYGDTLYTQLTGRAFELWREVEHELDAPLLRMLGGLDFGARRDVPGIAARLSDAGVAHELMDAAEAQRRWPGMIFQGPVLLHLQAGTVDADAAVLGMLAIARRFGTQVRYARRVASIADSGGIASIELDSPTGEVLTARCVVVAAGAWVESLLGSVLTLPPLVVSRRDVFHFPRRDPAAAPWPSVIHQDGEAAVYHLASGGPPADGDGGPPAKAGVAGGGGAGGGGAAGGGGGGADDRKVAEHAHERNATAWDLDRRVSPVARASIVDYVTRWLPGLEPTPRDETTCLYTSTPSQDFVLDRVGSIVVCSPCSGHGAKFAPLIGELVTDLVADGASRTVPERFRLAAHRAGLPGAVSL